MKQAVKKLKGSDYNKVDQTHSDTAKSITVKPTYSSE